LKYPGKNPNRDKIIALSTLLLEQEKENWPLDGANPQIFSYQFGPIDQYQLRPMIMKFYGSLEVYVSFIPDGVGLPF